MTDSRPPSQIEGQARGQTTLLPPDEDPDPAERDWILDERTRVVGRRGVQRAREALAAAIAQRTGERK